MILHFLALVSLDACAGLSTPHSSNPTPASSTTITYATSIPLLGGATSNFGYTVDAAPGANSITFNSTLAGTTGPNTFNYGTSANLTSAVSAIGTFTPNSSQTMSQSQINSQVAASAQNAAVQNFGSSSVVFGSGNTYTNAVSYTTLSTASQAIVTGVPGA